MNNLHGNVTVLSVTKQRVAAVTYVNEGEVSHNG
jgi:hypothetical protein